jgi:pyridoxine 5-phosphate synthase
MTLLSVNVNKLATLRNSRGGNVPDISQCARDILQFGAHGITVHPRPDGRHIRQQDVYDLRAVTHAFPGKPEFNIEGFPTADFLEMVEKVRPEQCTLVPDPPDALTSNAGWQMHKNHDFLYPVLARLRQANVRSSVFIDPFAWNEAEQEALISLRPDRVELYTEAYATEYSTPKRDAVTARYKDVANEISAAGIGLNAGHDLNLQNIKFLIQAIPQLKEVSIGHALIAESLYFGFKETIRRYLTEMA